MLAQKHRPNLFKNRLFSLFLKLLLLVFALYPFYSSRSAATRSLTNISSRFASFARTIKSSFSSLSLFSSVPPAQAVVGTLDITGTTGTIKPVGGIWNSSGQVGIGTTAPSAKLAVSAGSIVLDSGNNLYLNGVAGGALDTNWGVGKDASHNINVFGASSGTRAFQVLDGGAAGTPRMHIDFGTANSYINGGNVGIGTTAPTYKLDVNGATKTLGSDIFAQSDNVNTAYNYAPIQIREAQFAGAAYLAPRLSFHWSGVVASQIAMESDGTLAIRNNPGTAYEKFKSAMITDNGTNVGIGTTAPAAKLTIAGQSNIRIADYASLGRMYSSAATVLGNNVEVDTAAVAQMKIINTHASYAGSAIYMVGNDGITFHTAPSGAVTAGNVFSSPRMKIDDNGYVGIATTAPIAPFTILKSSADTSEANQGFVLYAAASDTKLQMGTIPSTYSYIQSMRHAIDWTSRPLVLQPNGGNVGIGTTGPLSKLSVGGAGTADTGVYGTGNVGVYGQGTSYGVYGQGTNYGMYGTGTTYGVYGNGNTIGVVAHNNSASGEALHAAQDNASGYALYALGGKNYFSGNVGIGTTSPQSALDVAAGAVTMGNGYAVGTRTGSNYRIEANTNAGCNPTTFYESPVGQGAYYCATGAITFATAFLTVAPKIAASASSANSAGIGSHVTAYNKTVSNFQGLVVTAWNDRGVTAFDWLAYGPTTATDFDLAEVYKTKDDTISSGDVVCIDPENNSHIIKCAKAYDKTAIGIVSTEPGMILGDQNIPHGKLVGLQGRVPVKVTLENGPIERGDPLTPSKTRPGYAMKATQAGQIIGKALQPFRGNTTVLEEGAFDGLNQKQIDAVAKEVQKTGEGKTMAFINLSWYDPDVYLTDTGDLKIIGQPNDSFIVTGKDNSPVNRLGAFAELVVGKIQTGVIEVKKLVVDKLFVEGVDILNKINELEQKVASQQQQIDELKKEIEELKK